MKTLEIQNFKSIKNLQLDCKRINVFIGNTNVGKSNILEALSLLGFPYEKNTDKYLSSFIRFEDLKNLFYDNYVRNPIFVKTDEEVVHFEFGLTNENDYDLLKFPLEAQISLEEVFRDRHKRMGYLAIQGNSDIKLAEIRKKSTLANHYNLKDSYSRVKKYDFKKLESYNEPFFDFLMPPYGDNLFNVIYGNKELAQEVGREFKPYGLDFVIRTEEEKFEIQKRVENFAYSYPYSSIADTLQRYIFYMTVIASNTDSVLLLEEPEVHSFPPYVQQLAFQVIASETNQFFISTHSSYLLHTLIENLGAEELGVYITYYEDYQTKVRLLSSEELVQILDESINIFYNLDRFIKNA